MAEESEDDSSKTEEPSQKKLEEARKRGQIASSRELTHFFMMLAFTFYVFHLAGRTGHGALDALTPFITRPDQYEMSAGGVIDMFQDITTRMLLLLAIPFLITIVAALAPAVLQRKIVFSTEHITPKLSKISPREGFTRMLGLKAIVEFLKNLLKVLIIGVMGVMIALPYQHELPQLLHSADKYTWAEYAQRICGKLLIAACLFLFLLGIIDYLYQRFLIMKSLRMSKQELKDEYRQQEGDPHIKGKLKQIRKERARKRMMANVPKADVIITNPTHYAVALKYDAAKMPAPIVLAKGADVVAGRIREIAGKHKIPILRNPPLARILYDTTDIDDPIPVEHYQAVAKIIGYVYRLKGKQLGGMGGGGKGPTMKLR